MPEAVTMSSTAEVPSVKLSFSAEVGVDDVRPRRAVQLVAGLAEQGHQIAGRRMGRRGP